MPGFRHPLRAMLAALSLLGLGVAAHAAPPLAIAAAADLQFALAEAKVAFLRTNPGVQLTITYGS